jgi:hypothetical protein
MLVGCKAADQRHVGAVAEGCFKTCEVSNEFLIRLIAEQDRDEALIPRNDIVPDKMALAFAAAALAEAQQPAQEGIGGAIGRIDEERRAVGEIEPAADDEANASLP